MKLGYGLTIFGILGFISTMTDQETRTLENFLVTLFFLVLGVYLIIKNKNQTSNSINSANDMKFKYINNMNSSENIIYPVHIKYKKIELKQYQDEKLNLKREFWYGPGGIEQNQPVYNCILDNKIVATLAYGQEADLEIIPGEHLIFFEPVNNLPRSKIKI